MCTVSKPDWFRGSADVLEPLFQQKNILYAKWLGSGRVSDRQKFMKVQQDTRKAVRSAKDTWFHSKAEVAQQQRSGGKEVWRSIRDMQWACRELIPQRTGIIKDEERQLCTSVDAKQQCWR